NPGRETQRPVSSRHSPSGRLLPAARHRAAGGGVKPRTSAGAVGGCSVGRVRAGRRLVRAGDPELLVWLTVRRARVRGVILDPRGPLGITVAPAITGIAVAVPGPRIRRRVAAAITAVAVAVAAAVTGVGIAISAIPAAISAIGVAVAIAVIVGVAVRR